MKRKRRSEDRDRAVRRGIVRWLLQGALYLVLGETSAATNWHVGEGDLPYVKATTGQPSAYDISQLQPFPGSDPGIPTVLAGEVWQRVSVRHLTYT